jgi:NAD(P)H-dependent flavin oxidoreductase YrpB (nitropropane dioxygenase family)
MNLLDRLRLEAPIVQAGMGGGLATADLAAAVSRSGGLGTVGMLAPQALASELSRARRMAGEHPVAANLLVPFVRKGHVEACVANQVAVVVIYAGRAPRAVRRLKRAGISVMQQVGTPTEARRAMADGVDLLIAQGREAGGHLVGVEPAVDALRRILAVADGRPVLVAGGVAGPEDVRRLLEAGAAAVVAGTRFLLTEESMAHPRYKERVLGADHTIETELFSFGWAMRHRVVPNAATERWCRDDAPGPTITRLLSRASSPLSRVIPMTAGDALLNRQRPDRPFFTPAAPLRGHPDRLVDCSALYAGESALRMSSVIPAAQAVGELAGGWS